MCTVGDIILVDHYQHKDISIAKHSFVVLSTENGTISGLEYDLICNVMSSFKNQEQKRKKLSYPGNYEIPNEGCIVKNGNKKDGYIKAEQLYYFKREQLSYQVIGQLSSEVLSLLLEFIYQLDIELEHIVTNLSS